MSDAFDSYVPKVAKVGGINPEPAGDVFDSYKPSTAPVQSDDPRGVVSRIGDAGLALVGAGPTGSVGANLLTPGKSGLIAAAGALEDQPIGTHQGAVTAQANALANQFDKSVVNINKGFGLDKLPGGVPTDAQINAEAPIDPNRNTLVSRVAGGVLPIIPAAVAAGPTAGPIIGATLGGLMGVGSARAEGEARGYTAGQTAGLAATRGGVNAILGLIPGLGGAGSIPAQFAKGALTAEGINIAGAGDEAVARQALGIDKPSIGAIGSAITGAVTSPESLVQAAGFGLGAAAHGVLSPPSTPEGAAVPTAAPLPEEVVPAQHELAGRLAEKYPDLKGNEIHALAEEMAKSAPIQAPGAAGTTDSPSPTAAPVRGGDAFDAYVPKGEGNAEGNPRNPTQVRQLPGGQNAPNEIPDVEKGVGPVVADQGGEAGPVTGNVDQGVNSSEQLPPQAVEQKGTLNNLPDYVREEIERNFSTAQKAGLVGRITDLSADRLTAKQIATKIGGNSGVDDVASLVRSVRAKLGIPSLDDTAAFEKWRDDKFGPGAANQNDPNFRKENPGSLPPPPGAPTTKGPATAEEAVAPSKAWSERIKDAAQSGLDSFNRSTGKLFPALSRTNPDAAIKAAEYISSPEVAKAQTAIAIRNVLGEQPVGSQLDKQVGDVILEDGLRGERERFTEQGNEKAAKAVKTIIGDDSHVLPTEAEYERLKNDPEIQRALAAHRSLVMPESERLYKAEAGISDEAEIPVRGRDTNTYLTRKAIRDDAPGGQVGTKGAEKKTSGMAQQAFGAGGQYANTYSEAIAHQFARQQAPGSQAELYSTLIKGGDAQYVSKPSDAPDGWKTYPVKIRTNVYLSDGEPSFVKSKNQFIAVKPEIATEFARITGEANNLEKGGLAHRFSDLNDSLATMSLAESSAHVVNHIAQLYKMMVYPGKNQGMLSKVGVGEANLANVPVLGKAASVLERVVGKWYDLSTKNPDALAQELEAARVGGLKPMGEKQSPIGKLAGALTLNPDLANNKTLVKYDPLTRFAGSIDQFTKVARLVGLDGFKAAVDAGVAKDTPINKANFINQFTQYHHEAQPLLVSLARKTGVGPFASAGQNFFTQRFKGLVGSPNFESTSNAQALRARVTNGLFVIGSLSAVGLANYLRFGSFKPTGTPVGSLVTSKTPDNRYKYVNAGQWMGLTPSGVTQGVTAALDDNSLNQVVDKTWKGLATGAASPYLGPVVKNASILASGYEPPPSLYDVAGRAKHGESQAGKNAVAALKNVNPIGQNLSSEDDYTKLLGAFATQTSARKNSR